MKKLLSVLLCVCLAAAVGCADSTQSVSSDDSESVSSAAEGSVPTEAEETSEIQSDAQTEQYADDTSEAEIDYSTLSDEEIYDLMVENSLMTTGDMTRMANVLKRAENGEEITVAYIGGSITEGLTVSYTNPELCWANLSTEWLREQYPDAVINYVNAGLSGTPSILGNARLERDVLAYDPDIVFVEFAVNDGTETEYKNNYESLVRTLLTQEKDIAVVLLFTVIESGHTCQPQMSQIGSNYDLPMISEPNSLGVELEAGRMTWQDYSDDESHPNEYGHQIVRDFVANYFENVIPYVGENTGEVDKSLPDPVFSDRYVNMHYIDNIELDAELVNFEEGSVHSWFSDGWSYKGSEDASMSFTLNCKALRLIYKANNSKVYADADIYVDGEKVMTVSANQSDGWSNPVSALIIDNDETAEHTVEIVVAGGENHYFEILGFGYTD